MTRRANICQALNPGAAAAAADTQKFLVSRLGMAVQVDPIKPRVETAYFFSASSFNLMNRFQTLLSISTCAATPGVARNLHAGSRAAGRGLHSSTSQLDVSTFCGLHHCTFRFVVGNVYGLGCVFQS
jgi:hypothetical protein